MLNFPHRSVLAPAACEHVSAATPVVSDEVAEFAVAGEAQAAAAAAPLPPAATSAVAPSSDVEASVKNDRESPEKRIDAEGAACAATGLEEDAHEMLELSPSIEVASFPCSKPQF